VFLLLKYTFENLKTFWSLKGW